MPIPLQGSLALESAFNTAGITRLMPTPAVPTGLSLPLYEFRRLALRKMMDLIGNVADWEEQRETSFVKRAPTPLERYWTTAELKAEARVALEALAGRFPGLGAFVTSAQDILGKLTLASSAFILLDAYNQLLELEETMLPQNLHLAADLFRITADARRVHLAVGGDYLGQRPALADAVEQNIAHIRFMGAMCALMEDLRERQRSPTEDESIAVLVAYELLSRGVPVPSAYQSLGVSGFRDIQTYLSLADPGDGHIKVTSSDPSLLRGVVVHVEHIDRDEEFDTELVEPYRLPAALHAAKVRLHVASHAPVTAFIGRPVFESHHFRRDLLKSAHMTASACTAMFRNGIADCKISMERMTATQAIEFMRAIVGNVLRDPSRQFLSAAFRINLPFVDDRPATTAQQGGPQIISDRMAVARLGVELAKAGGFDKVAWDGSSNEVPSIPIMDQLPLSRFVELAHLAHQAGLECYVSAGCVGDHMRPATLAAIDGVGVGTSLHYIDPATKLMGALKPEAIRAALQVRDEAAEEPFAQCSRLLARLDRTYANGGLSEVEDQQRLALYEALREGEGAQALRIAGQIAKIEARRPDFNPQWWSWFDEWEIIVELARQGPAAGAPLPAAAQAEVVDERQELESRLEHLRYAGPREKSDAALN